jgi:drug/metabolite transporter (DMT)-like permease
MMRYLPILAFLFLGTIWGSNFIFMKWAAEWLSPIQIVFFRVLFGFIPVALYAYFTNALSVKHLRHAGHFLMMALLATVIYYFGFAAGTALLPSGVAGALSGAIPLFTFVFAVAFLAQEKATPTKLLGVFAGLIGVVTIARPFGGELAQTNLEGVLFMVLGCLSIGTSFVYAKKFVSGLKISAAALTTYQLGAGLILLALIVDIDGTAGIWTDVPTAIGLVLGLGLLGTGAAYIAYYYSG